jgi:hypothetical protein
MRKDRWKKPHDLNFNLIFFSSDYCRFIEKGKVMYGFVLFMMTFYTSFLFINKTNLDDL